MCASYTRAHALISIKTCNTDSLLILYIYIISVSLPLSLSVLHRNLILLTIQRKWSEIKMNIKNVISFIWYNCLIVSYRYHLPEMKNPVCLILYYTFKRSTNIIRLKSRKYYRSIQLQMADH